MRLVLERKGVSGGGDTVTSNTRGQWFQSHSESKSTWWGLKIDHLEIENERLCTVAGVKYVNRIDLELFIC